MALHGFVRRPIIKLLCIVSLRPQNSLSGDAGGFQWLPNFDEKHPCEFIMGEARGRFMGEYGRGIQAQFGDQVKSFNRNQLPESWKLLKYCTTAVCQKVHD